MRTHYVVCCGLVVAVLCGHPSRGFAQTSGEQALRQEIDQLRSALADIQRQYGERLAALEARLGAAPTPPAAPAVPEQAQTPAAEVPPGAAGAGGPTGSLPIYGAASAASKIFNPDMAVIGDFLGAAGHNEVSPTPPLELHEAETSLQAIVDPYARGDFFVAFSPEGVEIEEGFITFPTVPGGLLVKVGKTRAAFGKVNTLHKSPAVVDGPPARDQQPRWP